MKEYKNGAIFGPPCRGLEGLLPLSSCDVMMQFRSQYVTFVVIMTTGCCISRRNVNHQNSYIFFRALVDVTVFNCICYK